MRAVGVAISVVVPLVLLAAFAVSISYVHSAAESEGSAFAATMRQEAIATGTADHYNAIQTRKERDKATKEARDELEADPTSQEAADRLARLQAEIESETAAENERRNNAGGMFDRYVRHHCRGKEKEVFPIAWRMGVNAEWSDINSAADSRNVTALLDALGAVPAAAVIRVLAHVNGVAPGMERRFSSEEGAEGETPPDWNPEWSSRESSARGLVPEAVALARCLNVGVHVLAVLIAQRVAAAVAPGHPMGAGLASAVVGLHPYWTQPSVTMTREVFAGLGVLLLAPIGSFIPGAQFMLVVGAGLIAAFGAPAEYDSGFTVALLVVVVGQVSVSAMSSRCSSLARPLMLTAILLGCSYAHSSTWIVVEAPKMEEMAAILPLWCTRGAQHLVAVAPVTSLTALIVFVHQQTLHGDLLRLSAALSCTIATSVAASGDEHQQLMAYVWIVLCVLLFAPVHLVAAVFVPLMAATRDLATTSSASLVSLAIAINIQLLWLRLGKEAATAARNKRLVALMRLCVLVDAIMLAILHCSVLASQSCTVGVAVTPLGRTPPEPTLCQLWKTYGMFGGNF